MSYLTPYPARYRPSRLTYAVLGGCIGVCATLAVCHAGGLQGGRGGVPDDVARLFTSAWFTPVRAVGGELTLRATPKWVRAEPSAQRQACEEAYAEWRRCRSSHWFVRLFVQDAGGVSVVTLAGTPRETTVEPTDFFG